MSNCNFFLYCQNSAHDDYESCKAVVSGYFKHKRGFVCPQCGLCLVRTFEDFFVFHRPHLRAFTGVKKLDVAKTTYRGVDAPPQPPPYVEVAAVVAPPLPAQVQSIPTSSLTPSPYVAVAQPTLVLPPQPAFSVAAVPSQVVPPPSPARVLSGPSSSSPIPIPIATTSSVLAPQLSAWDLSCTISVPMLKAPLKRFNEDIESPLDLSVIRTQSIRRAPAVQMTRQSHEELSERAVSHCNMMIHDPLAIHRLFLLNSHLIKRVDAMERANMAKNVAATVEDDRLTNHVSTDMDGMVFEIRDDDEEVVVKLEMPDQLDDESLIEQAPTILEETQIVEQAPIFPDRPEIVEATVETTDFVALPIPEPTEFEEQGDWQQDELMTEEIALPEYEPTIHSGIHIASKVMETRSGHESDGSSVHSDSSEDEDESIPRFGSGKCMPTSLPSRYVIGGSPSFGSDTLSEEEVENNALEMALRPFHEILNPRPVLNTDIDADVHNIASTSEMHDIGFENLRQARQENPMLHIRNTVNVDVEAGRVEQKYLRANKVVVVKTGLSLKRSPLL